MRKLEEVGRRVADRVRLRCERAILMLLVSVVVVLMFGSGCMDWWALSGPQLMPPEQIEISGQVREVGILIHPPIQGAIVQIAGEYGPADTTDEEGNYHITHEYLSDKLPIVVTREGYKVYTDTIAIDIEDNEEGTYSCYTKIHKDILLRKLQGE